MCSIKAQITKAPIAKIGHVLKAKAIAALEKYVSVSTFGTSYVSTKVSSDEIDHHQSNEHAIIDYSQQKS